ncbi:MAG: type II secretion system protein GspL [Novosphingobium sp.]
MATLLGWARRGLDWWLTELSEMVPDWVRQSLVRQRQTLIWDGRDGLKIAATGLSPTQDFGQADVCLPASACLLRKVSLPPMSRSDLDAMIALEAERLLPLPADRMLIAAVQARGESQPGNATVAGVSREGIEGLLSLLRERGIVPTALLAEEASVRVDFLPAARSVGLFSSEPPTRLVWWSIAGFLIVLNLVTLVWRDVDKVDRLQSIVNERRPLAMGARRAAQRLEGRTLLVRAAIKRRRESDPLVQLAIVSKVLPADAWIQRFAWDGRTLRIAGYRRTSGDLVKAFRDTGRFEEVRNTGSEVQAALPVGQPFDITARARLSS